MDNYSIILKICRRSLAFAGVDMFDEYWRPNLWTIAVFTLLITYPLSAIQYIRLYVDSLEVLAEAIALLITVVDAFFGTVELIVHREKWRNIMDEIHNSHRLFPSVEKVQRLFDDYSNLNVKYAKVFYVIYASATLSYTIMAALLPDERKFNLPIATSIYSMNPEGYLFYPVNLTHQIMGMLVTQHILLAQCCTLVTAVMSACCRLDAVRLMLEDFNERIRGAKDSPQALEQSLNKIIEAHAHSKDFIRRIGKHFAIVYLFLFATCGGIVFMSLNVVSKNIFSSTGSHMAAAFGTIFLQCYFGNRLLIVNENLYQAIYDIEWYKLSITGQKTFKFFLANAQLPTQLNGVLMPLNLATFVSVIDQYNFRIFF
ncbi:uncharacterized protein LOC129738395 [Uranotaenia lowii]|uniref:uncharacterized protein LOC129738395 n=1 Tax=Uranotaenia lowii TaxID=190385 RepID=UPI00247A9FB2|nr:uncharacterized protein LOC129738395 [Uranotaenia lowii]